MDKIHDDEAARELDGTSEPTGAGGVGTAEHPENPLYGRIRSFSRRGSRLGDKFEAVMAEFGPRYVIEYPHGGGITMMAEDADVDLAGAFGREAPLVVEIGPGSGEQLIANALARPELNFLALEAWGPGVARCVNAAAREGVENVKIMELDAAQGLPILFRDGGVNAKAREVWTFFPDPWRKKKHRKRRIVSDEFAATVAGVLEVGGTWRLATDWDNYAWQMRDVVTNAPWFDNEHDGANPDPNDEGEFGGGFAPRYVHRVMTRFEKRGIEAGRTIHDVEVVRNIVPVGDSTSAPEVDPAEAE